MTRVFNFGAGPAMLPTEVMEKAQQEFLDYAGMGASVIEISHRSKEFDAIINKADELLIELAHIPENYKILYVHGGAQMQFSAVPLNLINRTSARNAADVESGNSHEIELTPESTQALDKYRKQVEEISIE